jgi:hypothetical protein
VKALIILFLLVPGLAQADGAPKEQEQLVAAMASFTKAVQARDMKRFLGHFPRNGSWSIAPARYPGMKYDDPPDPPSRYTYAQLKAGLRKGGSFREEFFEIEDCLYTAFEITKFDSWVFKGGNTFGPPRGFSPPFYVRWRREGGRFVVDQIGTPET